MKSRDPYDDAHLFAEFVPAHLFAAILGPNAPAPMRADDELLPARDDLEDANR